MKKSFAFCILFIFLFIRISLSDDLDGITVSEHIYETPSAETTDGVESKSDESENIIAETDVVSQVEQAVQPRVRTQRREQAQRRDDNRPRQNREAREENESQIGTLLSISYSDFRYSRIPGITISDASSNRNIVMLEDEPNMDEDVEMFIDDTKRIVIEPDVLAKIGLLLFVFGVIVVYKLTSSKGSRKRKIKF